MRQPQRAPLMGFSTSAVSSSTQPSRLLLLPGLDGTGELYAPLLDVLGGAVTASVVRYEPERSFDDYVHAAAKALSPQNAVLVAESFSGPIALALCARYPANIKGLVLCATFAQSPFRSLLRLSPYAPNALLRPSPIQPLILRYVCLNGERDNRLLEQALSVLRSVPASTMHARLTTLSTIDMRPLLCSVNVPTLYLRATRDRVVHQRLGRALTDNLSNVVVQEIEGPHLLLQARPRECAEAIVRFATTLSIASSWDRQRDSHR
jgi:pimeloyl-[acyl-carrier protein] methyl ester esterase